MDAADRFVNLLRWGMSGPLWEAVTMYWQDYQNIANGVYRLPWDMTTRGHHQWNPLWVVQSGLSYIREAVFTLDRCCCACPEPCAGARVQLHHVRTVHFLQAPLASARHT